MTIALVNEEARNNDGGGTTYTITESPTATNGSLLVIYPACTISAATVSSVAQNSGTVSWQIAVQGSTHTAFGLVYAENAQSAGATTTVTTASSTIGDGTISCIYQEFSGLKTSGALKAGSAQYKTGTSVTTITTDTVTPASGVETLLVAFIRAANINSSPAGWTASTIINDGTNQFYHRIVTGDGSTAYSATWGMSSNANPSVIIAAFEAPGGGGGTQWGPQLSDQWNRIVQGGQ